MISKITSQVTVEPLSLANGSGPSFGAAVNNVDLENISGPRHQGPGPRLPKAQYEITQRFDPEAQGAYGHGKTLDAKRSILHPDLKTVPHQPQVQVIGNGFVPSYEGLENIQLRHPHHRTFHETTIPDEDDLDFTRFYRYDDGTGDEMQVPLGTTAFVNGETMYDLLSEEDKTFARESKVDGAAPVDPLAIQVLPLCWKNPVTGRLALQVHPSAVRKLHLADGTVIDDLEKVRDTVYRLQRPGIAPELVYAHDWQESDFVIFHNRGVLHSVVGAFAPDEVRLFRQCNIAGSEMPVGP
ncbi:unnamed protein product [Parascedosporium putredinis]|uniref:TauD/TfdA-like domain-containing protein n=1 Tax=Parascedosporium putredinis TaxID=1442378 RepID=A0A9P1GXV7_9PEZI|nr:unnamed protein product [Parascedosporium putredinis]CAI7991045.1 unnamed protein product [Parascedosporium putredinis]